MKFSYYSLLSKTCEESYWYFVQTFWHTVSKEKLVANWHMPYLAHEIQASVERVIAGEKNPFDTVVNICPGTSKSTLFSIFMLPWAWTRMPSFKFIGASFTESLAFDLSSKARQVVQSPLYQKCWPHIVINQGTNNKGHWENTLLGARFAVGVGGDVIGRHGHAIVIDDPLNPTGARSKADIEKAKLWCKETISSRKINKESAWTALVMQRLSVEDPTAVFLERGDCKHICLPGILTDYVSPPELVEKYQDGLFDPVRLSRENLSKMEQDLGTFGYAGQVLQTPIPPGGGLFKDNIIEHDMCPQIGDFTRIYRAWDRAATSDGGDYTVGVKMAIHKNGSFWILNVVRGRWSTDERERIILSTAKQDGQRVRIAIEREPGSAGIDSAKETMKRLAGYIVYAVPATGSKELRADTFSVQVNMGNVHMVKSNWGKDLKEELAHFPNGKNDDQVDACSLAFSMLAQKQVKIGVVK